MSIFRYATLLRPPGPGAVPRDSLTACGYDETVTPSGRHSWGWCEYNRRLSPDEISHFDLEQITHHENKEEGETMKKHMINFEAGEGRSTPGGVNFMTCLELPDLYAEIAVPDDASDDYGYRFLKQEIINQAASAGIDRSQLVFWYDGQEDKLSPDASAGMLWYAVQRDPSDDWSTGSYDRDEAVRMARAQLADYPDTLVAVVDNSTSNPVCVDEIRDF